MMGPHHAACGAAGWVAASSATVGFGWLDWDPAGFGLGILAAAGAALLPDLDHPNSTVTHALPPITTVLAVVTAKLSGGHRHGTHSVLGAVVFTAAAYNAAHLTANPGTVTVSGHSINLATRIGTLHWGAGLLVLLCAGMGMGALNLTRRSVTWPAGLLLAVLVCWKASPDPLWLTVAVSVGVVAHLAGDLLSNAGIPILWPFCPKPPRRIRTLSQPLWHRNGWMAVPLLGDAGSAREMLICLPIWAYAIIGGGSTLWATLPT